MNQSQQEINNWGTVFSRAPNDQVAANAPDLKGKVAITAEVVNHLAQQLQAVGYAEVDVALWSRRDKQTGQPKLTAQGSHMMGIKLGIPHVPQNRQQPYQQPQQQQAPQGNFPQASYPQPGAQQAPQQAPPPPAAPMAAPQPAPQPQQAPIQQAPPAAPQQQFQTYDPNAGGTPGPQ